MTENSQFQRMEFSNGGSQTGFRTLREEFLRRLADHVIDRFARITDQVAIAIPVHLPDSDDEHPLPRPSHPACVDFETSGQCQDSFKAHLEELDRSPAVHWHRCPFGQCCAFVPLNWRGRCLAACKLVCPASIADDAFEHYVELLAVLAENFMAGEARLLEQLVPRFQAGDVDEAPRPALTEEEARARARHPRVRDALDHISRHLADTRLSVAGIARELDINSTYIAHLFAEQVNMRMSRYIATRRVELAKKLLATTNWQIKRVAYESGHANADWFSQVFRAHTGTTPREYRRNARVS